MIKRTLCFFSAMLIACSLVACDKAPEKNENNSNSLKIVTSFYPVYVATVNLTDGVSGVSVSNLIDADFGCLHDYMLTPKDIEKVSGANLFIASGKDMESFVGNVSLGIPRLELLDCGEDIRHTLEEDGRANSHYWMNIENAIDQCDKIKRTLCRIDPMNTDKYEKNAEAYKAKLGKLIEDANARVSKLKDDKIAVYHDSFEYFADEFGIRTVTVTDANIKDGSYKRLLSGVEYILVQEDLADAKEVQKIAKETGCEIRTINTIVTGEISELSKDDYVRCIENNLAVLEEILG